MYLIIFGTTFYGHHDKKPDGSFIGTKWFHFFGIPLIPLETKRVRRMSTTQYQILEELPLDSLHVGRMYLLLLIAGIACTVALAGFGYVWSFKSNKETALTEHCAKFCNNCSAKDYKSRCIDRCKFDIKPFCDSR